MVAPAHTLTLDPPDVPRPDLNPGVDASTATDTERGAVAGGTRVPPTREARPSLPRTACETDPAVERSLLELDSRSRLLAPIGAGCNVLDFLLDGPAEIEAVVTTPSEGALFDLKRALFVRGWHDDLWRAFGLGRHSGFRPLLALLDDHLGTPGLRPLSAWADYFDPSCGDRTFHFRGGPGVAAWKARETLRRLHPLLWNELRILTEARTLDEQRLGYHRIADSLDRMLGSWLVHPRAFASLLGAVGAETRRHGHAGTPGELPGRIAARLRHLATEIPVRDNYFWRVALLGRYTPECCPNYLRREHFETIRARIHRVLVRTASTPSPRSGSPGAYTHVVLAEHQDWFAARDPRAFQDAWQRLLVRCRQGTRIVFRTSGPDPVLPRSVTASLRFLPERTRGLEARDRTAGFGGLHLAVVR